MSGESWGADVFDRLYAGNPDPWDFATSPYEAEKYRDTLDLLDAHAGSRRFANALELGCSIGVLTTLLAPRCERLLGIDAAAAAIATARTRCAPLPHVELRCGVVPGGWPGGTYDLVVLSELLYFLSAPDLERLARLVTDATRGDSVVLLANWTGPTDTPLTGDEAAACFIRAVAPRLAPRRAARRATYRLDLLTDAA